MAFPDADFTEDIALLSKTIEKIELFLLKVQLNIKKYYTICQQKKTSITQRRTKMKAR